MHNGDLPDFKIPYRMSHLTNSKKEYQDVSPFSFFFLWEGLGIQLGFIEQIILRVYPLVSKSVTNVTFV